VEADDKGKGVPVHTMNAYGGVEVASLILYIGTSWGEWSASHLSCFTPSVRPCTVLKRRQGGP